MWEFATTGYDGNSILFEVNIFDYEWKNTMQKVEVADPLYRQCHNLPIYSAEIEGRQVIFAAGEISNGIYIFYTNRIN